MNNSSKHIELLDYVRAIAIIAVLSFHTLGSTYGYEDLPWDGWLRDFSVPTSFFFFLPLSFGGMGVALFFVVSGFCIHVSFQQQGREWGSFWIRRFFRIYPAYLAAIALVVLCLMTNSNENLHHWLIWKQLLTHFFLVHNLDPRTFMGLNASFWSLAIEAQLYLVYPLLLVLVAKPGWRRAMVLLALGECLIRGVDGFVEAMDAENAGWGRVVWTLAQSPLGYWFSWALGAWVAESFLKNQPFPFAKASPTPWLIMAFASYFIKPMLPFMFVLTAVITTIVISKILTGARPGVTMPAFLSNTLKKIALWSYSIYLLHQPLLYIYCLVIDRLFPAQNHLHVAMFFLVVATWLIIIPISGLWYNVIELPGIALGKRLIQKRADRNKVPQKKPARQTVPAVFQSTSNYYLKLGAFVIAIAGSLFVSAQFAPLNFDQELQLGEIYNARHDFSDALKHYHRAIRLNKNSAAALNNAAWLLATVPDAHLRDGKVAVILATRACELTQYQEPIMIGTLAAADAEAGLFHDAVSNAQKAQAMALAQGQSAIAEKNGQLIQLYQANKPYPESPEPALQTH